MPVSAAMVEPLALQAGQRVLELAAGPGDTGLMAAALIKPGGVLVCSDGAEAMLEVARGRAAAAGIDNVEFAQLELEWIDLPTASVDAVLCRWGIMLIVDPEAAAHEVRRVLRPGGRAAFAVWDLPERNPWATIPSQVMMELGHVPPPDPEAPGMFTLAAEGSLQELLEAAGFVDVAVQAVPIERRYDAIEEYIQDTVEMSPTFSGRFGELESAAQDEVQAQVRAGAERFAVLGGKLVLPGSSLVAAASA
jgi:SAM-dependent methyltransferase